jgi:hypothetical protein
MRLGALIGVAAVVAVIGGGASAAPQANFEIFVIGTDGKNRVRLTTKSGVGPSAGSRSKRAHDRLHSLGARLGVLRPLDDGRRRRQSAPGCASTRTDSGVSEVGAERTSDRVHCVQPWGLLAGGPKLRDARRLRGPSRRERASRGLAQWKPWEPTSGLVARQPQASRRERRRRHDPVARPLGRERGRLWRANAYRRLPIASAHVVAERAGVRLLPARRSVDPERAERTAAASHPIARSSGLGAARALGLDRALAVARYRPLGYEESSITRPWNRRLVVALR